MQTESEIIEKGGKLFVLDPWQNHHSKPIKYRLAWSTGIDSRDYPHFIGEKAVAVGGGVYRLVKSGVCLRLEYGAETKNSAEACEERPIPKPRGMHEYRNGRWCV